MPAATIAGDLIRALAGEGVPGVAVLVAGPEGVRAGGAAGLADIAGHMPASPGMVCPWFPMTKIVTATAAMRLAEHGYSIWTHPFPGMSPRCVRCGHPSGPNGSQPVTCSPIAPACPTPSRSGGCTPPTSRLATRMRSCTACSPGMASCGSSRAHGQVIPTLGRWCWRPRWPPRRADRSPSWSARRSSTRSGSPPPHSPSHRRHGHTPRSATTRG
jgi:Beta-lactamase